MTLNTNVAASAAKEEISDNNQQCIVLNDTNDSARIQNRVEESPINANESGNDGRLEKKNLHRSIRNICCNSSLNDVRLHSEDRYDMTNSDLTKTNGEGNVKESITSVGNATTPSVNPQVSELTKTNGEGDVNGSIRSVGNATPPSVNPQVTAASSYEETMNSMMKRPYVAPSLKVASSYEQAMDIVLEKSLTEPGIEDNNGKHYDSGLDYNTVAEIAYKENDHMKNSVSWKPTPGGVKPEIVVGSSQSFDGNLYCGPNATPNGRQRTMSYQGANSASILKNGNTVFFEGNTRNADVSSSLKNVQLIDINGTDNLVKEKFQDDMAPPPEESFISQVTGNAWCFICPKLDPLPFSTFLALTFYAAIPAVLYIIAFTKIGYGLKVFNFIDTEMEPIAHILGGITAVFAMSLYLLDIFYWDTNCALLCKRLCYTVLVALLFSFIFALSAEHPYGPVGIFLVVTTSWMVLVRLICYRHVTPKVYISWLSGPLVFVSQGVALYWFIWTFKKEENEWNMINNLASAEEAGCKPNFDDYPQCDLEGDGVVCFEVNAEESSIEFDEYCEEICTQVYDSCLNSFIVWGGPFLVSVGFFFLSFVASFLRGDGTAEANIGKLAHSWMFLLFSMWISSCLAGAGTGVSTTLTALTFSAFAASAVFMIGGYSAYERNQRLLSLWDKIVDKYGSLLDPVRGLLIITSTPVGLIYLFISFVRQGLRKMNTCCSTPPTDTVSLKYIGGAGWLTIEARRLIRLVKSWDRVKVFTIAIYWGIAFMVLSVIVAQFSILFLSYLIEKTSDMNIALVTAILSLAGMVMFLLPPVPGVPIYLTLGIVIIPVGRDQFGIIGSIFYAMVVSLCLKLSACTLQQKMIGGLLQHKVAVRQFVSINSPLIRSMKLVLREKGFGIAKVAILIGGPDWPTSVLCGIMGLPLIPILVGTLPIILLILPTLLTGSFTYMANLRIDETGQQEFPWAATMATVCAAVTGIVQFGSMVVAAFFVERAVSTRTQELEALPIDQEVKDADDKLEEQTKAYIEVTQWHVVPTMAKFILYLSLTCMIISCYLVQLFSDDCFADYQLTYTIDQHLDGEWTNIVKPLGWKALILFAVSVVLLQIFTTWANNKVKAGGIAIYPEPPYPGKSGDHSERRINSAQVTTDYVQAP